MYCLSTDKQHVAPAATTRARGGRHYSQAAGATCRLGELAATGCGGRCHESLGELAATTQVIFFINFAWRWFFLTIHLLRWFFLPKIRQPVGTKSTEA
jgi:hypothetical protein